MAIANNTLCRSSFRQGTTDGARIRFGGSLGLESAGLCSLTSVKIEEIFSFFEHLLVCLVRMRSIWVLLSFFYKMLKFQNFIEKTEVFFLHQHIFVCAPS